MWLTELSIRRPLLILVALLAAMLGGVVAYGALGVDLLPSVKFPYVVVYVTYPGAGPREVESRVAKPIEDAVAGSPNLKSLISTSGDNYAIVVMEFEDGTDPDVAIQDVERRVNQVRASLPDGVKDPSIMKEDPADYPILVMGAQWDRNPDGLHDLIDDVVRPRLEAVEGISSVQIVGGREREIQVQVHREALDARGITLLQVTSALAAANLSAPSGYIQDGTSEYSLRVYGLLQQIDELGDLVVSANAGGQVVRLRDVATVQDGFKRQEYIARANGQEGVGILIHKQKTANAVAVTDEIQKTLKALERTLPPGIQITPVMNSAEFIRASLNSVQNNLRDAVLIVALVLLLFLHTWRSTLIVLVSIPTSLIATLAVMWLMGFTLNMMSMMGLALTIGILVDDSIVVLENIYRHMKLGESPWSAAFHGRAEIGAAAMAITLVDVVVYTPVAFLTGMVGQFFREFGGTIVVATLFSLLVSFTLTPMLASRWLTADAEERSPLAFLWRRWEAGYESLTRRYRWLLGHALRLRWAVLLIGLLAFVAGISLVGFGVVPTEFMTSSDQGEFSVVVDLPPGTALEGTNQALHRLEEGMIGIPEVESLLSTVGLGGQYGLPQHRSARIYVRLKPMAQRSRTVVQVAEDVRGLARSLPGMEARVQYPSIVGYTGQPVLLRVRGTDMKTLTDIAGRLEEVMRGTPGVIDVTNSAGQGAPELRVQVDQQRLSDLGLTTAQVASLLHTAFEGTVATELRRENEDKVDIRVLYSPATGNSELASIPDIPLVTPLGAEVRLNQVAQLVPVDGPSEIQREDRTRQVVLGANLEGRPLGEVTADLRQAIAEMSLPAGYAVAMAGDTELQEQGFSDLLKALAISILLIYLLMVALYDSLVYPLVIMGSIPVASVGAIGALAITGNTLSMFSMVGLIMLTGLVAKNAILLVDYTNTLRKRGYSRTEALLESGPTRLRPILMTTAAMVFAMIPLALKMGEGAETRSPLAIVVIGGLLTSMLLTLVVVPAGYTVLDDLQERIGRHLHRRPTPAPWTRQSATVGSPGSPDGVPEPFRRD